MTPSTFTIVWVFYEFRSAHAHHSIICRISLANLIWWTVRAVCKLKKKAIRDARNRPAGFPTRSYTKRPLHTQTRTKDKYLKFRECTYTILGIDPLSNYCAADLRLCFRICKICFLFFFLTQLSVCLFLKQVHF